MRIGNEITAVYTELSYTLVGQSSGLVYIKLIGVKDIRVVPIECPLTFHYR